MAGYEQRRDVSGVSARRGSYRGWFPRQGRIFTVANGTASGNGAQLLPCRGHECAAVLSHWDAVGGAEVALMERGHGFADLAEIVICAYLRVKLRAQ